MSPWIALSLVLSSLIAAPRDWWIRIGEIYLNACHRIPGLVRTWEWIAYDNPIMRRIR